MNAGYASPPQVQPPARKTNWALIIGIIVVLLLCCCCAAAVAFVYFNPLNLEFITPIQETIQDTVGKVLPSGGGGGSAPGAKAMPADTTAFIGVNMDKVDKAKVDQLIETFGDTLDIPADMRSVDSILGQIDQSMLAEGGMSLDEDIRPWVGDSIGVGFTDMQFDQYGDPTTVSFVVAVEVKDDAKAEAFIQKFIEMVTDQSGGSTTFAEIDHEGVTIFAQEADYTDEPMGAVALSGGFLLVGNSAQDVRGAIDAQKGDSLSENKNYQEIMRQLPGDAVAAIYFDASQLADLYMAVLEQTDMGGMDTQALMDTLQGQLGSYQGAALSLSFSDNALQFDIYGAIDTSQLTGVMKEVVDETAKSAGKRPETVGMFPEETYLYAVGYRLDLVWQVLREQMALMSGGELADFEQTMQEAEQQLGFSLDDDLFPYLDGEYAIGVFADSEGVFASQANVDIGFAFVAETSNKNALGETVDNFAQTIEGFGAPVESIGSGDFNLYGVSDGSSTMLVFGMAKNFLAIASSQSVVESFFEGGGKLPDSPGFKEMLSQLPSGMQPEFYVDIKGALGIIREGMGMLDLDSFNESVRALQPLTFVVVASAAPRGDIYHSVLIIGYKP